jgi:hypothetical protein
MGGVFGVLAQAPVVAAAFGTWLGFVLMIAALFVIFALGLVTILMASKGVECLIIWFA